MIMDRNGILEISKNVYHNHGPEVSKDYCEKLVVKKQS